MEQQIELKDVKDLETLKKYISAVKDMIISFPGDDEHHHIIQVMEKLEEDNSVTKAHLRAFFKLSDMISDRILGNIWFQNKKLWVIAVERNWKKNFIAIAESLMDLYAPNGDLSLIFQDYPFYLFFNEDVGAPFEENTLGTRKHAEKYAYKVLFNYVIKEQTRSRFPNVDDYLCVSHIDYEGESLLVSKYNRHSIVAFKDLPKVGLNVLYLMAQYIHSKGQWNPEVLERFKLPSEFSWNYALQHIGADKPSNKFNGKKVAAINIDFVPGNPEAFVVRFVNSPDMFGLYDVFFNNESCIVNYLRSYNLRTKHPLFEKIINYLHLGEDLRRLEPVPTKNTVKRAKRG